MEAAVTDVTTIDGGYDVVDLVAHAEVSPLVAILRAPSSEHFVEAAQVVVEQGFGAVEFTMTTPGALVALSEVRDLLGAGRLVGMGTVNTVTQARHAVEAGAQFLVSQVCHVDVLEYAVSCGVPYVPGALTPSEILAAHRLGPPVVKLSPIGPLGGAEYLSELVGPMPEVHMMPTGGVRVEDVGTYLRAGALMVGLSRDLFRTALLDGGLDALAERARRAVAVIDA